MTMNNYYQKKKGLINECTDIINLFSVNQNGDL